MAREPHFPEDASVGDVKKGGGAESRQSESAQGQAPASGTADEKPGRKKQIVTGAAIGIGSAAIVAALLYASKIKKKR